jgi:hypothetical protein
LVHNPVETIAAMTAEGFYEKAPYRAKIQEIKNILETIMRKVHKSLAQLMNKCRYIIMIKTLKN